MAGDEVRPPSEPVSITPDTPDDRAIEPARIAATDEVVPESRQDAVAELAASGRASEAFGERAAGAPLPRRSAMPAVLSVIGAILILLLAANLYTLYNPPGNDALTAAVAEVGGLKQRVAALEGRSQQTVDLALLDARVGALAGDVATLKTDGGQLKTDTAQLKTGLADIAGRADAAAGLDPKLTALAATVAAIPKVDLAPLDDRLAGLDKRLVPLEAYFNAPKATDQVTEARQNGSAAETRAAPLAVIGQGVVAAIEEGRPFTVEVDALAKLGVADAILAPLRAVADKGAVSRADLVTGFDAVEDAIVVAAAPVETGTLADRILANAQSIVKVTRTGAAAGSDAGAIASRIDADLKRGGYAAAFSEWEALPEASKARAAEWAGRLKARVAAEAAARSIATQAVAALAAAP